MAYADPTRLSRPLGEMNTTPLIDVLLVLLVMFLIALPIQTHSLVIDLPADCGAACPVLPSNPVTNKITIDAGGTVRWNGTGVDGPTLVRTLTATRAMPVEPELQFEPDANASYALSAQVLSIIEDSEVVNFGFVGNERYRQFDAD